ncbi:MAG: hypothetical protein ACOCRX_08655 [Candidatus Woesearchaeota archaeon]
MDQLSEKVNEVIDNIEKKRSKIDAKIQNLTGNKEKIEKKIEISRKKMVEAELNNNKSKVEKFKKNIQEFKLELNDIDENIEAYKKAKQTGIPDEIRIDLKKSVKLAKDKRKSEDKELRKERDELEEQKRNIEKRLKELEVHFKYSRNNEELNKLTKLIKYIDKRANQVHSLDEKHLIENWLAGKNIEQFFTLKNKVHEQVGEINHIDLGPKML